MCNEQKKEFEIRRFAWLKAVDQKIRKHLLGWSNIGYVVSPLIHVMVQNLCIDSNDMTQIIENQ